MWYALVVTDTILVEMMSYAAMKPFVIAGGICPVDIIILVNHVVVVGLKGDMQRFFTKLMNSSL